jgi:predicted transcriptional regulator
MFSKVSCKGNLIDYINLNSPIRIGNMEERPSSEETDRGLVALIVRSYVAHNNVGIDQLPHLISEVHRSLGGLGKEALHEVLVPAVSIKRSVQRDYVVCLECGFRSKMLRRHLHSQHGLEAASYRARWKLSPDHPLTAPGYSEHRSALAKELGLGHHRSRPSDQSPAAPEIPTRRGRKTSQPAATSPEVTTAPVPKRRGRRPQTAVAAD